MSDPIQLTGEVSKIWNNEPKRPYRVLVIDGKRYTDYDGKKTEGVAEGATVSFTYSDTGQYLNIFSKVAVVSAGNAPVSSVPVANLISAPPDIVPNTAVAALLQGPDARQVMIMKQNAVGHAVNFCNKQRDNPTPDEVVGVAHVFLTWYMEP